MPKIDRPRHDISFDRTMFMADDDKSNYMPLTLVPVMPWNVVQPGVLYYAQSELRPSIQSARASASVVIADENDDTRYNVRICMLNMKT